VKGSDVQQPLDFQKKKDIKKMGEMWDFFFIEAKDKNSNLLRERDYILQCYKKVSIHT